MLTKAALTTRHVGIVLSLAIVSTCAVSAELTVVNFGGAWGQVQKPSFYEPFEKATGNKITVVEYNGETAKVKAMVEAKAVNWDVVELESGELNRGCDDGLFEQLDWSKIAKKPDLVPGASQACGVGFVVWAMANAYNADKLKVAPTSWVDFWDVKKIPGKRGMRKGARFNLEIALMADGVAPKDVYKVLGTKTGQDRAFKKLDELKPNIQWWEAGAQPPQFLVAGDVVMSTAFNGRIDAARKEGQNLKLVWNESIQDLDYWAIPKGAPNKALAEQFIAYTLTQQPQQAFTQRIAYGPANLLAIKSLDATTLANLPNSPGNSQNALRQDIQFWTDHGDELEARFTAWASK